MAQALTVKPVTSTQERPLVTIEFAPNIHPSQTQYSYEHPLFVFGNRVELINSFPSIEYTVCALELIESKTPSGRLLSQPRWKYKITNGQTSFWKEESALIRYAEKTCSSCARFQDYNEPNGRGWCQQFNHQAKTHHIQTDDCIHRTELQELDRPHAEYEIGSIVKVIDEDEDHTEWEIFEVSESKYNHFFYRNSDSYLNETEWYYRLTSFKNGCSSFWVAQNQICAFNMSHNVCTEEIF